MRHVSNHSGVITRRLVTVLGVALAITLCASCGPDQEQEAIDQTGFKTPEEAVTALVAAVRADDMAKMTAILGPDSEDLLDSGDEVADKNGREDYLELFDEAHRTEIEEEGVAILYIGSLDWPFPIPIVAEEGLWYFDTMEGREEIIDRRVGRNELSTIQVCLAYVDAQQEYFRTDWDEDGILEYAQKKRSSPDKKDGLYWPTEEGEELSPLGDMAADAEEEGYDVDDPAEGPRPYHGYFFRILKSQGENAPGGAYDYLVGENMIGGFALVAWPAEHADSGVMTFLVNHDGKVFEKDLGPETAELVKAITSFDPDDSWKPAPTE